MRCQILLAAAVFASPALAEDSARVVAAMAGSVNVNASYTINTPLVGATAEAASEEERQYIRLMYQRAAHECADLLATVATSCQITNISISSQISRSPGTPPAIYVSSNVSMQISLKE